MAIFAVFLIGKVVSHYPSANYDSIVFTKLNPALISNQDHKLPQDSATVLLPSFKEPIVRTLLTSYEIPQAQVPFTTYELPLLKTAKDNNIGSTETAKFNAQNLKKNEQSTNIFNFNKVSQQFEVPSTETPTEFNSENQEHEGLSTQSAGFKTQDLEYGVPSEKSSDFNPLSDEYGLPKKAIPFSKYAVPSLKTNFFNNLSDDDSVQLIPSTSYGIPAERVPVPSNEYQVPTITLPLEYLSSEYGLPNARTPASIYGLPH